MEPDANERVLSDAVNDWVAARLKLPQKETATTEPPTGAAAGL